MRPLPAASHDGLCELRVDVGELSVGVKLGDSVALNGCCLTVTAIDDKVLAFQAVPETLREPIFELLHRVLRACEQAELAIISGYLPDELTGDELRAAAEAVIEASASLEPRPRRTA